jgi:hypothetical protein
MVAVARIVPQPRLAGARVRKDMQGYASLRKGNQKNSAGRCALVGTGGGGRNRASCRAGRKPRVPQYEPRTMRNCPFPESRNGRSNFARGSGVFDFYRKGPAIRSAGGSDGNGQSPRRKLWQLTAAKLEQIKRRRLGRTATQRPREKSSRSGHFNIFCDFDRPGHRSLSLRERNSHAKVKVAKAIAARAAAGNPRLAVRKRFV